MPVSRGSLHLYSWQYWTKSAAVRDLRFEAILNGHSIKTCMVMWEKLETHLNSFHACLQLKLSNQFLRLSNTVAAAHFTWYCLTCKIKNITLWTSCIFSICTNGRSKTRMFYLIQSVTSGCASVSGQERSCLPFFQLHTPNPFYSPTVSFQRVCDFKGPYITRLEMS